MRVLVACEYSGRVRNAFAALSHVSLSLSCDLLPAEDGSPNHYQGDVFDIVDDGWDLMIAHPPCTFLNSAGLHWISRGRIEADGRPRVEHQKEALEFIERLWRVNIKRKCLENPQGCINTKLSFMPKPQYVQPYEYGDDASKKTGLWLDALPELTPTRYVPPKYGCSCGYRFELALGRYGCPNCMGEGSVKQVWANQTNSGQNKLTPADDRWKERSRTYQGIADAMAAQWSSCA